MAIAYNKQQLETHKKERATKAKELAQLPTPEVKDPAVAPAAEGQAEGKEDANESQPEAVRYSGGRFRYRVKAFGQKPSNAPRN